MSVLRLILSVIACSLMVSFAHAVQPDEMLKDPVLEARARSISAGLRCLVCQNQSIDESEASVAKDLRLLIRDQIIQGRNDTEVVDFVVARYGEYVLLRPRFNLSTFVLWLSPFALVFAGLALAFRRMRRPETGHAALSAAEKAELDSIFRN